MEQSILEKLGFTFNRRSPEANNRTDVFENDLNKELALSDIEQFLPEDAIGINKLTLDNLQVNENISSANYVQNSSGFNIQGNGNAEFNAGIFRGAITGSTIDIGGSDDSSFHVDVDGNLWSGAATYATAPFKVSNAGAVVGTNITATGTMNATGGYIGTTTALVFEGQGINCGAIGYIRGNQTDFNTGVGWYLGNSGGAYKFSIGDPDGNYLTWNGSDLTLVGNMILQSVLLNVVYTVANLPVPAGAAGFTSPTAND
ncbi:MAG: hypothetical protein KKH44_10570 [Bacteroidetes bacterium]|nr:hypothetical protein [Bacteroidota bacterium]